MKTLYISFISFINLLIPKTSIFVFYVTNLFRSYFKNSMVMLFIIVISKPLLVLLINLVISFLMRVMIINVIHADDLPPSDQKEPDVVPNETKTSLGFFSEIKKAIINFFISTEIKPSSEPEPRVILDEFKSFVFAEVNIINDKELLPPPHRLIPITPEIIKQPVTNTLETSLPFFNTPILKELHYKLQECFNNEQLFETTYELIKSNYDFLMSYAQIEPSQYFQRHLNLYLNELSKTVLSKEEMISYFYYRATFLAYHKALLEDQQDNYYVVYNYYEQNLVKIRHSIAKVLKK